MSSQQVSPCTAIPTRRDGSLTAAGSSASRPGGPGMAAPSDGAVATTRNGPVLRVASLCGAASVVVSLVGSMVSDLAAKGLNPDSPDQTLIDTFVDNRRQLQVGITLTMLGVVLLLVFLGPLWIRVKAGAEWLAVVTVAAGVTIAVVGVISAAMLTVMVTTTDYRNPDAARLLMLALWDTARVGAAPYAAMIGAATLAGLRYRVLPRWLNLFGVVFFLFTTVALLPIGPAGLLGSLGGLWIIAVSVHLSLTSIPVAGNDPNVAD